MHVAAVPDGIRQSMALPADAATMQVTKGASFT
jgi:hypothetical protein